MSDEVPTECAAFAVVVTAVLDGDAPAAELSSAHAQTCRDCRELAAAARLLAAAGPALQTLPVTPTDLTPRLVKAMARRRRPWLPALAACLAVAGGVWLTRPVGPAVPGVAKQVLPDKAAPTTAPPVRVSDQLATVASVARSASEKAAAPTRLLSASNLKLTTASRPTGDPLASLGTATKTAAAPVADSTRRAVGLFLRDLGLSAKPAG